MVTGQPQLRSPRLGSTEVTTGSPERPSTPHSDPLFFALLVALNLQTAFLSPLVAMAAFYLKAWVRRT